MQPHGRPATLAVLAATSWAILQTSAAAQPRDVLVLDAGPPGRPLAVQFFEALRTTLATDSDELISTYYEALDFERFPDASHVTRTRGFLGDKYRRHPPSVLATLGSTAGRMAVDLKAAHRPNADIVFAVGGEEIAEELRRAGATGRITRLDVAGTLEAALSLLPDTEEVALVGSAELSRQAAERALEALGDRVRVTRLVDMPLDEVERQISSLPATGSRPTGAPRARWHASVRDSRRPEQHPPLRANTEGSGCCPRDHDAHGGIPQVPRHGDPAHPDQC